MDAQYFMRVRGRVLGPFDCAKLQSLSRRGQLSRMHEISTDGVNWSRASVYPELFHMPADEKTNGANTARKSSETQVPTDGPSPPQPPPWHFTLNGQEQTPVDFARLQAYAAAGQLRPDDQVWTSGMTGWVSAKEINGLTFSSQQAPVVSVPVVSPGASSNAELDAGLSRSAFGSRPWVIFLVVVGFISAALQAVAGFLSLVAGGRAGSIGGGLIASGIFQLIGAATWSVGCFLLLAYANRLSGLIYNRQPMMLERALDSLRAFWIYISIVVMVGLALVVILISLIIASVVSLPQFEL